ncbi:MAG TPA: hypothetical protein VHW23_29020 [Kofleriaceae bacterium]|jgi:hypothetical protein|nr:hypothetical protein [Kofleriaceae bacterium]
MADLTDLIVRGWGVLSRWAVPVMMALAYALLVATSETDATGKAWMATGLVLVLIAWFAFRAMADTAALSRALSVGDTEALTALANRELARRRRPAARARPLIARGFALLLRGEHAAALAALDEARPGPELAPLAAAARILARIELGHSIEPGAAAVSAPRTPWLGWLVDGAIAARDGRLDAAAPLLARVIDDIRAGSALRAIAHLHAARIADARGDAPDAARHRTAAAEPAAPDAAWLRGAAASPPAA